MKKSLLLGAAVLALMSANAAYAASPADALVIGTSLNTIASLDPAVTNARTPSEVFSNIYDTLLTVPAEDMGQLEPAIAESWTVSDDARTITMKIRSGVTFSSGNALTANDVAWTLQRVVKIGGVGASDISRWGFTADNIEEMVKATDDETLVISLPEAVSVDLVLLSLTSPSLGILDEKTVLANEVDGDLGQSWLKSNAAGSGPFVLRQWRPNDMVLCDRRDDYWAGAPAMKRVVMRHIPESGNLRLQIEAGDVDIGQYMAGGDLEALEASGKVSVDQGAGLGFYYIALNAKDPDLAKPQVREAFQHIMDWKALAQTTVKYSGFPWQSIIPRGMPGAPTGEPDGYEYDPELAKQLLAEAGYPDGLKKVLYPSGAGTQLSISVALQASAAAAGIDLEVVPGEHTPDFRARNYEVLVGNSGSRLPDPYGTFLQYAYNPDNSDEANLAGYNLWRTALDAPELTKMVDQVKVETDPAKREELFRQVDAAYKAMDPTLIVFFQRMDPYAIRAGVEGYESHPAWAIHWRNVTKN